MRSFAESRQDSNIVQQLVGQIPWGLNIALLTKMNNYPERIWYARATIENGWSRVVLIHQIESGLFQRQGKAITNFDRHLPGAQSDLAQQTLFSASDLWRMKKIFEAYSGLEKVAPLAREIGWI